MNKKFLAIITGLLGLSFSSTQSEANLLITSRVERVQSALYQQIKMENAKNLSDKSVPVQIAECDYRAWRDWSDWSDWSDWYDY